jgi:hypothetical protein
LHNTPVGSLHSRALGKLDFEKVAYWYFRLNGCLTIPNFVVHPDRGRDQETDVDIIAVRFPFRAENLLRPMKDDPDIARDGLRTRIIFAEVKTSVCSLNGPWTNKDRRNMQRLLSAVGVFPKDMIESVAQSLYERGFYNDSHYHTSLFCVGSVRNPQVTADYPDVPQKTWDQVAEFIFNRFAMYKDQKVSHQQWDETGKRLWDVFRKAKDLEEFQQLVAPTHSPREIPIL